jgi:hypothetical protein
MKRQFILTICSALALAAIQPSAIPRGSGATREALATSEPGAAKARAREGFGKLPLYLVENRGQLDKRVAFYAQGGDTTVYFTGQGLTFSLNDNRQARASQESSPLQQGASRGDPPRAGPLSRYALALDFVGARADLRPVGRQQTSAVFSYFKGPRERWQAGLKSFSQVAYENVWPGIDLVIDGAVNRMKYAFLVKPGTDPNQIRLSYRGATGLRVNQGGQLEVETPVKVLTDERPAAWQEGNGRKVEVSSEYLLEPVTGSGELRYGFRVGGYDRGRELVIDPEMLVYSGFIGGSGDDNGYGIAVDGVGNAYVTGETNSPDFPVVVGPDTSLSSRDAFVAKVRADGSGLEYCGYIGGSGGDSGQGIAVDGAGNAYVAGWTSSADFPVAVGPDATINGAVDAFVAKVRTDGAGLDYCGYIGGSGLDVGYGIAVDGAGNAYVTGNISSLAFVAKVRADGTGLVYNRYVDALFGSHYSYGIAVDSAGNAYVTGQVQPHFDRPDAFVAMVRADGIGIVRPFYIGGSLNDSGRGIAVDSAGNAYVTGWTDSPNFPCGRWLDSSFDGSRSAFVWNVGGGYLSCIGGSGEDIGNGIAVDTAGNAYVTGYTNSSDFPVVMGPDTSFNGASDAWVAKVKADGSGLEYSGYIGGSSSDGGSGIAVDGRGNAYVTGFTVSPNFPVRVGPDISFNGLRDAFVAKIVSPSLIPQQVIGQLIDQVEDLIAAGRLKRGPGEALINKLEVALKQLDRGHINPAINQLESFVHRVDGWVDKGDLTPAEGQSLTVPANEIIALLRGQ